LAGAVASKSVGVNAGVEACPELEGAGVALAQAERNAARQSMVRI
jgi:hypothetical protein